MKVHLAHSMLYWKRTLPTVRQANLRRMGNIGLTYWPRAPSPAALRSATRPPSEAKGLSSSDHLSGAVER